MSDSYSYSTVVACAPSLADLATDIWNGSNYNKGITSTPPTTCPEYKIGIPPLNNNISTDGDKSPHKGAFAAKLSKQNTPYSYAAENYNLIDRITNIFLGEKPLERLDNAFNSYQGITSNFSITRTTAEFTHAAIGMYDIHIAETPERQVASFINTLVYNVNRNTNFLSGHHPLIQCSLEVGFNTFKSFSLPKLLLGGLFIAADQPKAVKELLSMILTTGICINRETNTGFYKEEIDKVLNILKTSLYFLDVQNVASQAIQNAITPENLLKAIAALKIFTLGTELHNLLNDTNENITHSDLEEKFNLTIAGNTTTENLHEEL